MKDPNPFAEIPAAATEEHRWTPEFEADLLRLAKSCEDFRAAHITRTETSVVLDMPDDDPRYLDFLQQANEIRQKIDALDSPFDALQNLKRIGDAPGMYRIRSQALSNLAKESPEQATEESSTFHASMGKPFSEARRAEEYAIRLREYGYAQRKRIEDKLKSTDEASFWTGVKMLVEQKKRSLELPPEYFRTNAAAAYVLRKAGEGLGALQLFLAALPPEFFNEARIIDRPISQILEPLQKREEYQGLDKTEFLKRVYLDPECPLSLKIHLGVDTYELRTFVPPPECLALLEVAKNLPHANTYLALFSLDKLPSPADPAIISELFDAYLAERSTHKILKHPQEFLPNIQALPKAAQDDLFGAAFSANDFTFISALLAAGIHLDEESNIRILQKKLLPSRLAEVKQWFTVLQSPIPNTPEVLSNVSERIQTLITQYPTESLPIAQFIQSLWPTGEPLPDFPWLPVYGRIEKLQAHSARLEYDPWETDLKPLVRKLTQEKILDPESTHGAEILYDFVRQYGMKNLPTIFRWHKAVLEAKDVQSIPEDVKTEIESALRIKLSKLSNKGLITNEIKRFSGKIQQALLLDTEPKGILTPAGQELFLSATGRTKWSRKDDPRMNIIHTLETLKTNPELRVKPEHVEVTFEVPILERRRLTTEEEQSYQNARRDLLSKPETVEATTSLHERFNQARNSNLQNSIQQYQGELLRILRASSSSHNEKLAHEDIEKHVAALKSQEALIENLQQSALGIEKLLEIARTIPGQESQILQLSADHIYALLPLAQRNDLDALLSRSEPVVSEELLRAWHTLLTGYIGEHYLQPEQAPAHTGHVAFSEKLTETLISAWDVEKGASQHPIPLAVRQLEELERTTLWQTSNKTIPVTLVPVKGILRTYAGDIGDACYSSKHAELSKGEFPGITAYIYVTNRNTLKERLRGSLLAVETKTAGDAGASALVVRANNPQDALIQQVDAEVLVAKSLAAMRELAQRLHISHVGVPRDTENQSSSNRSSVSQYYRKHFATAKKMPLIQSPETEFNGYKIWDHTAKHAVVEIGAE